MRGLIQRPQSVYHGWWVVAVGTLALTLGSGLTMASFGLYVTPLEDEFGWSRAEVSLGFSASILGSGIAAPLVGQWLDSRGARSVILLGGVLTAAAFVLIATTQSLWQFYLFNGILALARTMMFFLPFQTLVSYWFRRQRGVALSILGSGFSLGGVIVLPIVAAVIEAVGWRGAYVFSGAALLLLFWPLAYLFVRNRPADVGEHIDGGDSDAEATSQAADLAGRGLALSQVLRLPLFWVCALGCTLLFFGILGWTAHQVPFFESRGMSRTLATSIAAASAGLSIFSRVAMGFIADRVERFEFVVALLLGLLAASMAALLVSTAWPAVALFLFCWVAGTSAGPMVETVVLIKAFGLRYFGSILGAVLVIETLGQVVSPSLAGEIYDRTGSYDGALVMLIAAFCGGLVLFLLASRMTLPVSDRDP